MAHNKAKEIRERVMMFKRSLHISNTLLKRTSFDKHLNFTKPVKSWERASSKKNQRNSMDKDTWFKNKYAHVHARQKNLPNRDQYGKKAAHEMKLRNIERETKKKKLEHRQQYSHRRITNTLEENPLLECLYGTNSVTAALMNPRRESFTRLLYYGNSSKDLIMPKIKELSLQDKIKFQECSKHELNVLSKFNLHNNIILETKPLESIELSQLGSIDQSDNKFNISVIDQDEMILLDDDTSEKTISKSIDYSVNENKTYPVGLFLDDVMDPHNVGAIIRSAYFLGVDFIIMTKNNSASLTPVVSKASSGAMEFLPIYHVTDPVKFFQESQKDVNDGWTFITSHCTRSTNQEQSQFAKNKTLPITDLEGMPLQSPVMLVVGNEGKGVRSSLRQISDYFVEIPFQGPETPTAHLVDSLNVSVASAILINHLLPCK